MAAECADAGRRLPPLPSFSEAVQGDRARQFADLGYTFWNQELLDALALRLRLLQADEPCPWVELAAGTGRWSAELARCGIAVAATDNFSQQEPLGSRRGIVYGSWVGRLSAREALAQLRPAGVLCAWPPLGSGLILDLLQGRWEGSESLRAVVCIGEPSGATEAPEHPDLLPAGWELSRWPDCDRYLIGFNDPPPGPGWRTYSQLLVYVRPQQRSHTGNSGGEAEPAD